MTESTPFLPLLITALVAGLAGGLAMNAFMRMLTSKNAVPVDMTALLGILLTQSGNKAASKGTLIHLGFGVVFGLLYLWGMHAIAGVTLPASLFIGLGIGVVHGVIISLMLMFLVRDTHPDEKQRGSEITFMTGLAYLAGHACYGATVGLVGGLLFLLFTN